ncbi:BPSS1780 family membrane protein [Alcanivorax limicola]|uniref:BPSS1780 family membrane protein n=1 Tax=Alcanivorax limicola TaxID=2874102 RepID=UPI001CBC639F|nr:BPSS1780 family membrane protein [Alcanivorax limicola]
MQDYQGNNGQPNDSNPYQQPQADVMPPRPESTLVINAPRGRDVGAGWRWISDGWRIFCNAKAVVFFGAVLLWLISGAIQQVPLLGILASFILAPVFSAGLLMLAYNADEQQSPRIGNIFRGFQEQFTPLLLLGLSYLGLFLGALIVGGIIGYLLFADMFSAMLNMAMSEQPGFPGGEGVLLRMVLLALIMAALFIPAMALYWFAPALVFFGKRPVGEALMMSLRGCLSNIMPMLWYGIAVVLLVILLMLPSLVLMLVAAALGAGVAAYILAWLPSLGFFLVLFPVLAVSYYSSFRDIYTDSL